MPDLKIYFSSVFVWRWTPQGGNNSNVAQLASKLQSFFQKIIRSSSSYQIEIKFASNHQLPNFNDDVIRANSLGAREGAHTVISKAYRDIWHQNSSMLSSQVLTLEILYLSILLNFFVKFNSNPRYTVASFNVASLHF